MRDFDMVNFATGGLKMLEIPLCNSCNVWGRWDIQGVTNP